VAGRQKKGQGAVDEPNGRIDHLQRANLKYALPPPQHFYVLSTSRLIYTQ